MNTSYGRYGGGGGGSFPGLRQSLKTFSEKIMPVIPQVTVVGDEVPEQPMAGPGQMPSWLPWAAVGTGLVVAGVLFTSARRR